MQLGRRQRAVGVATIMLIALVAVFARAGEPERAPRPRRVVLFIGDGMGLSHVSLGRVAAARLGRSYAFERFRTIGLASTRSFDQTVTDSAAGATALSSGYKTKNGALGVDAKDAPHPTILERAHDAGFATGLVTTTRITHATPAGFASHVTWREREEEVASQYVQAGIVDVLMGGGERFFPLERLKEMRQKGYAVVTDRSSLAAVTVSKTTRILGLFNKEHMSYEVERGATVEPSLREMTDKALDVLGQEGRPFFCMVEGGKIDHAAHHHDAAALIHEQLAFADAIDAALDRLERDPELLVVVTADHTTGALAISESFDLEALLRVRVSAETLVARFGAAVIDSRAVTEKVCKESFGFEPSERDLEDAERGRKLFGPLIALGHLASTRMGVGFYDLDFQQGGKPGTHGHEGSLVPVFSAGPGAERFLGTYENTRIPIETAQLLGLKLSDKVYR